MQSASRLLAILLALCGAGWGEPTRHTIVEFPEEIRSAALGIDGGELITWGRDLTLWRLGRAGSVESRIAAASDHYQAACAVDFSGGGGTEIVAQEGPGLGTLVRHKGPAWAREVIDTGIEMGDCIGTTLHGRRGVLMVHRYTQVRFYEPPEEPGGRWPYREIYSIYTASRQAGLLLADVDGDGRTDIVCGNYWIRNPESFDLPWRIFAINTHSETPDAATMRFALVPGEKGRPWSLAAAQRAMGRARLNLFVRPGDVKQQWEARPLADGFDIRFPQALAAGDFDGDGVEDLAVGENNGAQSRLLFLKGTGGGKFEAREIARGEPSLFAAFVEVDGGPALVTAGPRSILLWKFR